MSIVPCKMTAQCAAINKASMEEISNRSSFPWLNDQGTDIAFESISSGVVYSGSSYAYSYTSGDDTYFSVGFTCTSGGCTAQVNRVYELNGKIHVDVSVKGPGSGQISTCVMTYPYVSGKFAKTDMQVVFDGAAGSLGSENIM